MLTRNPPRQCRVGGGWCTVTWLLLVVALVPPRAHVVSAFSFSTTTTTTTRPLPVTGGEYRHRRRHDPSITSLRVRRLPIADDFPGLEKVYRNPDVFVIRDFLDADACGDLIARASARGLETSPVAYAGWTRDFKELLELAAKGPVTWLALVSAWFQVKDATFESSVDQQISLVVHGLQNYALVFVTAAALIAGYTKFRANDLQGQRTSTSTTLDDLRVPSSGTTQFVTRAAQLLDPRNSLVDEAALFEAPTVIRYEAGQVLQPHYDANQYGADTEDANRGGQTLVTLLVYLNDVAQGGKTRFGKLLNADGEPLTVQPQRGDALLFFPADEDGTFNPELEHEGCPAVDEKWIARIWRHQFRVPPPFGLADTELERLATYKVSSPRTKNSKNKKAAAQDERPAAAGFAR